MVELKTKKTEVKVSDFLDTVSEDKREDSKTIAKIMEEISGDKPKMWGSSIVGYTDVHLKYDSGRELDWFKMGFSPRKQNLTLYVLNGGEEKYRDLLDALGKHSTGKGCLYIKRLSDVNIDVLKKIITRAAK